jgi:hypothetical protein
MKHVPRRRRLIGLGVLMILAGIFDGASSIRAQEPQPIFRTSIAVVPITAVVHDARNRIVPKPPRISKIARQNGGRSLSSPTAWIPAARCRRLRCPGWPVRSTCRYTSSLSCHPVILTLAPASPVLMMTSQTWRTGRVEP